MLTITAGVWLAGASVVVVASPGVRLGTRAQDSPSRDQPVERVASAERDSSAGGPTVRVVEGRSEALPGIPSGYRLGMGEIEHGRARLALGPVAGEVLELSASAAAGDEFRLCLDGGLYRLVVESLGVPIVEVQDARFVLQRIDRCGATDATLLPPPATESEKIDRLMACAARWPDATFVRNGKSYGAGEAAAHRRRKMNGAGDRVQTAREFIDRIATRSTTSGDACTIQFTDGRRTSSAEFLRDALRKIEAPGEPSDAPLPVSPPDPSP